jgi:FKBP-type peptidyl-prolyl cis-trans isomerase FkpA/FKBP-type peptidyl-prolyl cis-trans isomerase FklB
MRPLTALMALAVFVVLAPAHAEAPALDSEEDKVFYTLGLAISQNLASLGLTEQEVTLIQAGLADGLLGRDPRVEPEVYGPKIQATLQTRAAAITQREKDEGKAFAAKAAEEAGAVTTESGVVYLELEPGDGASPSASDSVKVHYHGTLPDGEVFDSSVDGDPVTFALNAVIGCFSEGIQKMKVGGKSKLTCPSDTAYGDGGRPPKIRPGATLVFEVELLEIVGQTETAAPAVP